MREETRQLVLAELKRSQPQQEREVGVSMTESLEQSLRRAVGRQFSCEPLTELDMQVAKCSSLRPTTRGDGATLMREKLIQVEDVQVGKEEEPAPPQADPLRMLMPGGKLVVGSGRFLSEEDM